MAASLHSFPYARYTEEVWNAHNPEALTEFCAPDARVHSMTPGIVVGSSLDYLKGGRARSLFSTFPDVRLQIEEILEEGDISLHASRWKARNKASLQGLASPASS